MGEVEAVAERDVAGWLVAVANGQFADQTLLQSGKYSKRHYTAGSRGDELRDDQRHEHAHVLGTDKKSYGTAVGLGKQAYCIHMASEITSVDYNLRWPVCTGFRGERRGIRRNRLSTR